MNDPKKDFKKKVKRAILIDLALSLYFSGMFNTAMKTFNFAKALNPFSHLIQATKTGWPVGLFLIIFVVFGLLFGYLLLQIAKDMQGMDKMGRLFKQTTKRQSYGDSHFEEPEEYKKVASIQTPEHAYGTIVGQIGEDGSRLVNLRMDNTRANRNIAVVGASGSGKTYSFSKPFCYQCAKRRESIVITDPDGGLYRDVAGFFEDQGYVVRRFDLTNLAKSDGWDCMKSIRPESADLDAQIFAQTVISNTAEDLTSIYANGPMSLLKALVLRVYLGHDYPAEKKNIQSVYALLQNPRGEEFLDTVFDAYQLTDEEMPCLGPYLAFKSGSPNLRGNLITNLAIQLQLFQSQLVCQVLSTDDINLLLPGQQPCAYFCLFPDSHDTYRFIVSLFFSMIFQNLIAYADLECGGVLPVPVNFLLDEFPSIGCIPDWDRKMATIRKRNLSATMIFQNVTQLQNLYETSWVTILSNCSTMISLGINDGDTADLWTKRIGDTTIQAKTEQHPINEAFFAFNHANSTGEGRRALLSYDELHKIEEDDCIVLFQNHNPVWLHKYPHVLHPSYKMTRTILPKDIPDISDAAGRAQRREEEQRRLEEYYSTHPREISRDYTGLCESDEEVKPDSDIKAGARKAALWAADKIDSFAGQRGSKAADNPADEDDCEEVFITDEEVFEIQMMPTQADSNGDAPQPIELPHEAVSAPVSDAGDAKASDAHQQKEPVPERTAASGAPPRKHTPSPAFASDKQGMVEPEAIVVPDLPPSARRKTDRKPPRFSAEIHNQANTAGVMPPAKKAKAEDNTQSDS